VFRPDTRGTEIGGTGPQLIRLVVAGPFEDRTANMTEGAQSVQERFQKSFGPENPRVDMNGCPVLPLTIEQGGPGRCIYLDFQVRRVRQRCR
jgi:hypothetical protein